MSNGTKYKVLSNKERFLLMERLKCDALLEADVNGSIQHFNWEQFRKLVNENSTTNIRTKMKSRTAVWGKIKLLNVYYKDKKTCCNPGCFVTIPRTDDECHKCYIDDLYRHANMSAPDSPEYTQSSHIYGCNDPIAKVSSSYW